MIKSVPHQHPEKSTEEEGKELLQAKVDLITEVFTEKLLLNETESQKIKAYFENSAFPEQQKTALTPTLYRLLYLINPEFKDTDIEDIKDELGNDGQLNTEIYNLQADNPQIGFDDCVIDFKKLALLYDEDSKDGIATLKQEFIFAVCQAMLECNIKIPARFLIQLSNKQRENLAQKNEGIQKYDQSLEKKVKEIRKRLVEQEAHPSILENVIEGEYKHSQSENEKLTKSLSHFLKAYPNPLDFLSEVILKSKPESPWTSTQSLSPSSPA